MRCSLVRAREKRSCKKHKQHTHHHTCKLAAPMYPAPILAPPQAGMWNVCAYSHIARSHYCLSPENLNVFVNHLSPDITDDGLRRMFSTFGNIESAKVMVDLSTGLSRGFGFVKFSDIESGMYYLLACGRTYCML